MRGFIGLNGDGSGDRCQLTGFLPLHAVVANGHTKMYDFLCDLPGCGVDDNLRADEKATSGTTPMLDECAKEYGTDLNALQLACQLGDHKMFKHVIGRQMGTLWKWGPVTQNQIDLLGIDSAPGKGGEVLELIGRFDAKTSTQEMLLDDFMEGFLQEVRPLTSRSTSGSSSHLLATPPPLRQLASRSAETSGSSSPPCSPPCSPCLACSPGGRWIDTTLRSSSWRSGRPSASTCGSSIACSISRTSSRSPSTPSGSRRTRRPR